MSGPTANLPVGLLDALGIKSGAYPRNLLEDIRPTIDIIDVIGTVNCTELLNASSNVTASGFFANTAIFRVPQGETWLVNGAVARAATLVGESIVMSLAVFAELPPGSFLPVRKWPAEGSRAAGVSLVTCGCQSPFWVASGMSIGVAVEQTTTAGTIVASVTAQILRGRR